MNKVGVCIAGLDGAVASTLIAGTALIRKGLSSPVGLISREYLKSHRLVGLDSLVFGGWDIKGEDLLRAATRNGVIQPERLESIAGELRGLRPWPGGPASKNYRVAARNIEEFRRRKKLEAVIVINLLPTGAHQESRSYALAALETGSPLINFTPNDCGEGKLTEIPYCGRDGKTGQTWIKSLVAPGFRARALQINGWYSTNLLGNEDGQVVGDPRLGKAKIRSKTKLLADMLGYEPHHQVQINYYPPAGDNKESWDCIDFEGFLGMKMQLKLNGLWRDSVLAAPMCLDLVRFIELARRRGERGPQEWLSFFFKSPYRKKSAGTPVHDIFRQEQMLRDYLESAEKE